MKAYVFNVYTHKEVLWHLGLDKPKKLWKRFCVTAPDMQFAIKLLNSPFYREKFRFPLDCQIKFAYEIPTNHTALTELK